MAKYDLVITMKGGTVLTPTKTFDDDGPYGRIDADMYTSVVADAIKVGGALSFDRGLVVNMGEVEWASVKPAGDRPRDAIAHRNASTL